MTKPSAKTRDNRSEFSESNVLMPKPNHGEVISNERNVIWLMFARSCRKSALMAFSPEINPKNSPGSAA